MATHPPEETVGITNVTLLTDATTLLPLLQLGQELTPKPTAKSREWSTFCGTFAGYCLEFRLLKALMKLLAIGVAFWGGGFVNDCSVAVTVRLSTATVGVSMKGEAATMYLPAPLSAVTRMLVVWPGTIRIVSVLKGFTYVASTSTTTRTTSWSGFGKGYGTPSLGKMTRPPWTVALSHRICACHKSVPLWPVIVKL
ncbi:hypothetical protein ACJIZ3_022119 [Penstemon smallii]|uniref:Uncharacterized protein n=1 Tax=Penstemon smallii TaxID=265156 RepID=A0ABD3SNZ2_9LAMI